MSSNRVRFTVKEVLAHLDDEDFEEGELILPVDSVILPEQEKEEINLRTVQIEETDDSEEEVAKGRPSNAVHAAGTYTQAPQENLPEVNWNQKDGTLERINCPQLISSYNTYMGGVDKNNQEK
ncbi:hypothetical protein P5673_025764 [Acropora cervicornis]|uniref:Uncharacterized protein n=1 Tax=Acropora cervicornis TaxID=6130 RepID=A0AAD9UWX9_ACRCE|nr:hypothetical protein P5673_025764 [Acropora cervicornis]